MLSILLYFITSEDIDIKHICVRTNDTLQKCSVSNAAVLTNLNQYSYHFDDVQIEIINTVETVQTIDLTYFQQFRTKFYSNDLAYISFKLDNSELLDKGSIELVNLCIVNNRHYDESLTLSRSDFKNVSLLYPDKFITLFSDEITCDETSLCCFSHITTHNFGLNFTDSETDYHEAEIFCMTAQLMSKVTFYNVLDDASFYDDSDCAILSSRNLKLKIYGTQTTVAKFSTVSNSNITFLIENHTPLRQYIFSLHGGQIYLYDNSENLSTSYIQIRVHQPSIINLQSPYAYPDICTYSTCDIIAKGSDKWISTIENINMDKIKIESTKIMISSFQMSGKLDATNGCQLEVEKLIVSKTTIDIPTTITLTVTKVMEVYGSIAGNINFAPTMEKIRWTPRVGTASIDTDKTLDFGRENITLEIFVANYDLNSSKPEEYDNIMNKEMYFACSPTLNNFTFRETFSKDSVPGFTPDTAIAGFFNKRDKDRQCFGMVLYDQPYKKSVHLVYTDQGQSGPVGGIYYVNRNTINSDFGWKSAYIKSFTLQVNESMEKTTFLLDNIPSVPIRIIGRDSATVISVDFGTNYFPSITIENCTLIPKSTNINASVVDISRADIQTINKLHIHNADLVRMSIFQVEIIDLKNITDLELEHTARVDATIENGLLISHKCPLDAKSVIFRATKSTAGSQTTYSFRINGSFRGNPIVLAPDQDIEYIVVFDNSGHNQTAVLKPIDSAKLTVRLYPTKDQIFVPIDFSDTKSVSLTSILTSVRAQIPLLNISQVITIETDDTIIATEVEKAVLHHGAMLNPGHRFDRQLTTTLKHVEIDPEAVAGMSNVALNDVRIGEGGIVRLYDVDSTNCTINVTMLKSVPVHSPVFIAISPHAVKPPKSIDFYYNANIVNMTNGTSVPLVGFGSNLIDRSFVSVINLKQLSRSTGQSIGIFDNSEPRVVGNLEFEHQNIVAKFEIDEGGQRIPLWLAIVAISVCALAVAGSLILSIVCFCPRNKSKKESFRPGVTNEQLLYRDEDQSDSF